MEKFEFITEEELELKERWKDTKCTCKAYLHMKVKTIDKNLKIGEKSIICDYCAFTKHGYYKSEDQQYV